jgi:hypothetical protein
MLNASVPTAAGASQAHGRVILAASLGTGFEWYDFFSLRPAFGKNPLRSPRGSTARSGRQVIP